MVERECARERNPEALGFASCPALVEQENRRESVGEMVSGLPGAMVISVKTAGGRTT